MLLLKKHVNGKVILEKGKKKDQNIRELMSKHNTMKGSTLPEDMKLYRYELVEILLKAGIPLAKLRFVDEQYKVQQRLIRLEVLARSLNAEQLAQRLIQCLAVDYGITPPHLLAAMRDGAAAGIFVCATYYLEGDGPLVFSCYERLSTLAHAIAIEAYPNCRGQSQAACRCEPCTLQSAYCKGKGLHKPGFQYFQRKFSVEFRSTVRAFKAARLCCPVKVQELHPNAASVQALKSLVFFLMVRLQVLSKNCLITWPVQMAQFASQRM
ncbi:hypothetical protein QZH41_018187 [Actinostola sp. cb2023]|nr:hypothetical protein QZH41_018187 [Actinostola sp. cb2023]